MTADFFGLIKDFLPLSISLIVVLFLLWLANRLLLQRKVKLNPETILTRQMVMIGLSVMGLVFVLLSIPMSEATRGQILSLLGIVFTGIIAFSSSSLIANIMGGLMIRFIKNFHPGDFIRVNEQFGRVTEVGLMHTEIQTEDRDLITFPNIFLISNPVKTMQSSGTVISASLSLGYDLGHSHIEELLKKAAGKAGLDDPFIQITELGDFSVTYRVAGILKDVKMLLTVRSDLRKQILDTLHNEHLEIVSPTFMNTRNITTEKPFIPKHNDHQKEKQPKKEDLPEKIIFDKADEAETLEQLKNRYDELLKKEPELKKSLKNSTTGEKEKLEKAIETNKQQITRLENKIKRLTDESKDEN